MDTARMIALLQASPGPPWYDRATLVLIALSAVFVVAATSSYPFSLRLIGMGLLMHFTATAILFGEITAGIYPSLLDVAPFLAQDYEERDWLLRVLFIGGAVLVTVGFVREIRHDLRDPRSEVTWRLIGKRLAVLVLVTAVVWFCMRTVHRYRDGTLHERDWWLVVLGVIVAVSAVVVGAWQLWSRARARRNGEP